MAGLEWSIQFPQEPALKARKLTALGVSDSAPQRGAMHLHPGRSDLRLAMNERRLSQKIAFSRNTRNIECRWSGSSAGPCVRYSKRPKSLLSSFETSQGDIERVLQDATQRPSEKVLQGTSTLQGLKSSQMIRPAHYRASDRQHRCGAKSWNAKHGHEQMIRSG